MTQQETYDASRDIVREATTPALVSAKAIAYLIEKIEEMQDEKNALISDNADFVPDELDKVIAILEAARYVPIEAPLHVTNSHEIEKMIPQFWQRVGLLSEASFEVSRKHSPGTSNWGAHILKRYHARYGTDIVLEGRNKFLEEENRILKAKVSELEANRGMKKTVARDTEEACEGTLYQRTGNIGDQNTMLINRGMLETIMLSANRWCGLMGIARFRIIGSAGVLEQPELKMDPNYVHVGCELWTMYGNYDGIQAANVEGRATFIRLADASYKQNVQDALKHL